MNTDVMFSRASDNWSTPQAFWAELDREFGGFVVDAAATAENAKCRLWFGPGGLVTDALSVSDWRPDDGGGAIWLNPPYSRCHAFIAKASEQGRRVPVVCLVPARTDTRWWHEHVYDAAARAWRPGVDVRFIKGRLKFGDSQNSAPFPSAVVIFRPTSGGSGLVSELDNPLARESGTRHA